MRLSMKTLLSAAALLATCTSAAGNNSNPQSAQILATSFTPPQHWRNVNLVRNINLQKNYPRETINVVIENVGDSAQDEYYLPFEASIIGRVGGFEVRDKKNADGPVFQAETAEYDTYSPTTYYRIKLPTPLAPSAQQTLAISYSILSALTPFPAAIEQAEQQFVQYHFSAYMPSAYTTLKQKTKLKFSNPQVPDYTVLTNSGGLSENSQDPKVEGTTFTYGPFSELAAGAMEGVSVRYEFTKPLTHVETLERDVEVSHWGGNLATEERYVLHNRAAALKNQFSRIEWQKSAYFNPPTSALQALKMVLKPGSSDPYFTDDIGNVTTSRWRQHDGNLELKPRYPVFGNWNYKFRVGWNMDLKHVLRKMRSGDGYVLRVPFIEGPNNAEGIEFEKVTVRVILPEGATNIKYDTSVMVTTSTISLHRTFMDTKGRTMLTLTAFNLVDDQRDNDLIVTYDYAFLAAFRKPVTIIVAVFSIFAVAVALARVNIRISRGKI